MWMQDKTVEAPGRLENLKELISALGEFQSLDVFLEHIALVIDNNSAAQQEAVSIMTLHSAKGLEFDTVFLPGWEEGVFPNGRALDSVGREALEEERRLAYVGLTRARHRAYIYYAANRRIHGAWQSSHPSRFIDELPKDAIEVHTPPGLFMRQGYRQEARAKKYADYEDVPKGGLRQPPLHFSQYRLQDRVFHVKFGYGYIKDINGDKLDVDFEHSGLKKVIASFIKKA